MWGLQHIFSIEWKERVKNEEVLVHTSCRSTFQMVKIHILPFEMAQTSEKKAGRRVAEDILYSQLSSGARRRGHPLQDSICCQMGLVAIDIPYGNWEELLEYPPQWWWKLQNGGTHLAKEWLAKLSGKGLH